MDKKKKRILFISEEFKTWETTVSRDIDTFKGLENRFEKLFVENEKECRKILESTAIDWICLDYNSWEEITALDIVKNLRESGCNVPICVFFSYNDEEECKEAGASITITAKGENGIYGAIAKLFEYLVEDSSIIQKQ